MTLKTLIGEEAILTFLAVQRRSIVNHLGMNLKEKLKVLVTKHYHKKLIDSHLNFMNPLHVIAQLIQILDVPIANFTDDKLRFSTAGIRTLSRLDPCLLLLSRQWCD
jgi:hypothetical protein